MTIESQLKRIISIKYKSMSEFAEKADLPKTTVINALNRSIYTSGSQNIYKICKALEIDFYALMEGQIKDYVEDKFALTLKENNLISSYRRLDDFGVEAIDGLLKVEYERNEFYDNKEDYTYKPFPLMPASAGVGIYIDNDYREALKVPRSSIVDKADFVLRVAGDSMEPKYSNGDIVLVKSMPCVNIGQIGIFILNGEAYIKELGYNELISKNPKYEPIEIKDTDVLKCLGLVLGKTKEVE